MHALVFDGFGGPEVLCFAEVPDHARWRERQAPKRALAISKAAAQWARSS